MRLQITYSVFRTNTALRLALDGFVDEVRTLDRPAVRHVLTLDLHLLAQDLLPYFASVFADIRTATHHTLVRDDADSEVVRLKPVVLPTHNFRCHIAGRAGSFTGIVWCKNARNSKICEPQIALVVEHKVFWLDITMNDIR